MKTSLLIVGLWFGFIAFIQAQPLSFESGEARVNLIELYTSEGCSSCPPADEWVSEFKEDARLWDQIIPVVFHVDYWDQIGWPDRFAESEFSDRQRLYAMADHVSTVYTPGMMLNGREWRGWYYKQPVSDHANLNDHTTGNLKVTIDGKQLTANFSPNANLDYANLNIAVLGFDLETQVERGENQGRILKHDFVVLGHQRVAMQREKGVLSAQATLPKIKETSTKQAVVTWIDTSGDLTPLQATGGWLNEMTKQVAAK